MPPLHRRELFALTLCVPAIIAAGKPRGRIDTIELALDGRTTGYRLLIPEHGNRWPVILFSHGARSSNRLYDRLLTSWSSRGMAIIAPNHLDHDGLRTPAGDELWRTRLEDMTNPINHRELFDRAASEAGGRLDWSHVAMAGHSYGALVAQVLAGAKTALAIDRPLPLIACVAAFSPPGPRPRLTPRDSWDSVTVPALLQTGDKDIIPGFIDDWEQHKIGFDVSTGRQRWLAIGRGVDHFFGGLICQPGTPSDPAQYPALMASARASGDFLRAILGGDRTADQSLISGHYGPDLAVTRL